MKTTAIKKKKVKENLEYIGYKGELTYEDVAEWLMEEHDYYIMPTPVACNKWQANVVVLNRPNKKDGRLNLFEGKEKYDTLKKALAHDVEFIVDGLVKGRKEYAKHVYDKEWMERIENHAKEMGWD